MSDIINYFDLNKIESKQEKTRNTSNDLLQETSGNFVEVQQNNNVVGKQIDDEQTLEHVSDTKISTIQQIGIYSGILVGVIFNVVLEDIRQGKEVQWLKIPVCFLIAIIIVPYVWEKLQVDPNAPFIVKFGLFVQNGFFWSAIVDITIPA